MSPLKHKRLRPPAVALAVLFAAAIVCSCARREQTVEDAESAGKKKKLAANAAEVDQALARAATEALGDHEGAVLVMDPQTGRLRAVVNPRLAFEQAFPPGSTIKCFTALAAMRAGLIDRESRPSAVLLSSRVRGADVTDEISA